MGLEYEKLKKGLKGKASNPTKKIKIEKDKKVKELRKKVKALEKQIHQVKKKASEASSQWENKYAINTKKYKKENVEARRDEPLISSPPINLPIFVTKLRKAKKRI